MARRLLSLFEETSPTGLGGGALSGAGFGIEPTGVYWSGRGVFGALER